MTGHGSRSKADDRGTRPLRPACILKGTCSLEDTLCAAVVADDTVDERSDTCPSTDPVPEVERLMLQAQARGEGHYRVTAKGRCFTFSRRARGCIDTDAARALPAAAYHIERASKAESKLRALFQLAFGWLRSK